MTTKQRQKKFREALRAQGLKRYEIWLPTEPLFLNALADLKFQVKMRHISSEEIVNALEEYDDELGIIDPSESITHTDW